MASGTIYGSTGNQYIDSKIVWSAVANESENSSTVTAKLYYKRNNTGYTTKGTGSFSLTVGGNKTSDTVYVSITENDWVLALTATEIISHNSDGTMKVFIIATGSIPSTTLSSTSCSATVTLDTIARASSLDSLYCATKYFSGKLTYKYTPQSSSLYNRCNISLNIDGTFTAVKSISLGKKSASQQTATVTLSDDELAIIYNELPKTNKGTLRFTFRTYRDSDYSTQVGDADAKDISLYIPNNSTTKPTATMAITPVTTLEAPFDSLYIKGRTKVDANFTNGTGKYGASIVSYKMSVGGKSYGSPYTSEYLSTTGDITVTGTVTDSRGFTQEYTKTITVIAYEEPKILSATDESEIICARCDADGNLSESGTYLKIKARRSYYKVTSGGVQNNFCAIRYRYRAESTNTFSDWVTILAKDDTSTNTIDSDAIPNVVSSIETAYVVQVGVIDDIGESDAVQFMIPTDFVTVDIPEDYKGRSIGIFRHAVEPDGDEKRIDIDGNIHGGGVDNLTLGTRLSATSAAPLDLNDYTTPGNYYSPNATNSQYITNTPYVDGGFSLIVRQIQSTSYIRQEIYYGRTNWQRHWYSETNEWSAWLRFLMTTEDTSTSVDFVTETGLFETDTGSWRYKKWKSGTYDLSGVFDVTPISAGTTGGVYYSEQVQIELPFSVESIQYTGSPAEQYCLFVNAALVSKGDADNNGTIGFRLMRFTEFSTESVSVRLVARGRWK